MNLSELLTETSKVQNITLLCEKNIDKILCGEYLGSTIKIDGIRFKIDTLRFNDTASFYTSKQILARVVVEDYLCGLIPKGSQLRKDLFNYGPCVQEGYIIVMRKKSPKTLLLQ